MNLGWDRVLPVWWSFFWRAAVYGFIGGAVLGGIFGFIAGATGHLDKASFYGSVGGYIAGIPASFLGLKQALSVHLNSLALLARSADA